jgi:putative tricarboxylic transport membrane protein
MIDGLADAVAALLQWPNPPLIIAGILFGMLIGFLPGMAGSVALALLIPVSFTMETESAILFLVAAYSPAGFGGMLTSILVNTPGNPENAATTFDGYPLTKQGRAGAAIGAATAASVIGGLIGTVVLLALLPPAQEMILALSFPEFFMMAVLGLTVIAIVADGRPAKGLIAAGLGLLISFIGLDPISGRARFTFDSNYFWDGVDVVPVLLGLFAGAEVLALFGRAKAISGIGTPGAANQTMKKLDGPVTFWQGVWVTFRYKFLLLRASILGVIIGIVPGTGGAVAGFMAYAHAKQSSRHPELFGKGAIDGVIAAESANDAKEGGSLLPTVAFGIPGTVGMAVLLGALMVHGVPTGPSLMATHSYVVYLIIIAMVASKFIAPVVVWLISKRVNWLTSIPPGVFTPLITVAAVVGAYSTRTHMADVLLAMFFGYVGYAMKRYGFSRIALIIALVLGGLVERSYYQTVRSFGDASALLSRPISLTLAVLSVLIIAHAVFRAFRPKRKAASASPDMTTAEAIEAAAEADAEEDEDELAETDKKQPGRLLFNLLLIAFTLYILVSALNITGDARTMPLFVAVPTIAILAFVMIQDTLRHRLAPERTSNRIPSLPQLAAALAPAGAQVGSTEEAALQPAARVGSPATGSVPETQEARPELDQDSVVLWRQAAFGLWVCGLTLLAALFGLLVALPVALFVFFMVLSGEGVKKSVLLSVGTTAALYLLFGVALDIPIF